MSGPTYEPNPFLTIARRTSTDPRAFVLPNNTRDLNAHTRKHAKSIGCISRFKDKRKKGSIQIPVTRRPFISHSTFLLLGTFLFSTLLLVTPQRAFAHGSETYDGVTSPPVTTKMSVDANDTLGDIHHSDRMPPDHHENGLAGLNDSSSVTPQDASHDHSAHAPSNEMLETAFGRFLFWLGKFHPAAVHFPIAMLLGAAFAEVAAFRFNTKFSAMQRVSVYG